jgi:hypothetical protein
MKVAEFSYYDDKNLFTVILDFGAILKEISAGYELFWVVPS